MDPTERFAARAEAYAAARPGYPQATLEHLRRDYRLGPDLVVADVGSGTGIWSRLLLEAGARVFGVEPNDDMRANAEAKGVNDARFTSVAGRAEATTLHDASVDLVTAAQAYHWFDAPKFHAEAVRILRPGGKIALVWNDREIGTAFLRDYDAILREHCPGYAALQGKSETPEKFDALFGPSRWTRHTAANRQELDRPGLVGRVMSASYAPRSGPEKDALVAALEAAFDRATSGGAGRVAITYTTTTIGGVPLR